MTHRTARPPTSEESDQIPAAFEPKAGDTVQDTATRKIGKVMGAVGPYVQLRPIAGGKEWDALPEDLEPVSATEALRDAVAATNARSRGEL